MRPLHCFIISTLLPIVLLPIATTADRDVLIASVNRLNSDVLELRDEIESSISKRCDSIRGCYKTSYDECQSEYTSRQTCPTIDETGYAIPECGAGNKCNGVFDESITTVRIPRTVANGPNGNPKNPEVVEAVCYTRTAQKWMVDKHNEDKELWRSLGTTSPHMYFGSNTGVFRIFPARQSRECGTYDPRTRPWYQATVPTTISNEVKPRNVVILIDTSRSMNATMARNPPETKLSLMKKIVKSTIASLSERASIAVIRYGEIPMMVGREGSEEPFMWKRATASHKASLTKAIDAIEVRGRSNKIKAFDFAFKLIKNSLRRIKAMDKHDCELENIGFLVFTDGKHNMPADVTDEDILDFVSSEVKEVESMGDYTMHNFFYSLSKSDTLSKQISCVTDGYWMLITPNMAPGNVTVGYQTLFSTPMGTDAFYNFTSWSSPYNFSTSKELGYTVSALVYDRDVAPPRFMGAVGMDISAEAARKLYGGTMEETVIVMKGILGERMENEFNATCEQQRINLTYCETQSMRYHYGGYEAICLPDQAELTPDEANILFSPATPNNGVLFPTPATTNNGVVFPSPTTVETIINVTDGNTTQNFTEIIEVDVPTKAEVEEAFFEGLLKCEEAFTKPCPGYDEYPDDMWRNVNLQGKSYHDRVCCETETNMLSKQCPKLDEVRDTRLSDAAIFGIMFGAIVAVEIVCCYYCFYYRKRRNNLTLADL